MWLADAVSVALLTVSADDPVYVGGVCVADALSVALLTVSADVAVFVPALNVAEADSVALPVDTAHVAEYTKTKVSANSTHGLSSVVAVSFSARSPAAASPNLKSES